MNPVKQNPHRKRLSRWILIGLTGFVLVSLVWSSIAAQIDRDYQTAIDGIHRENSNLAKAFEEHVRQTLNGVDGQLSLICAEYQRESKLSNSLRDMIKLAAFNPAILQVSVVDSHGNDLISLITPFDTGNVADREYFKVHRESANYGLYIDKPTLGRTTGKWSIRISRRMNNPDGSFKGVASVALGTDYFGQFYKELEMGKGKIISINGLDGIIRARVENDTIQSGIDISQGKLFQRVKQKSFDNFWVTTVSDGQKRYMSYRVLPDYRLFVIVGVLETEAMAEFTHRRTEHFIRAGIASVAICLVFGVFGVMLRRREWDARVQKSLYQISEAAASDNSDDFYSSVRHILLEAVPAKNFYIALCDPDRTMIYYPVQVDERELLNARRPFTSGLCEYVIRTGNPLLGTPEKIAELELSEGVKRQRPMGVQWMGVPLRESDGTVFGVLVVKSYKETPKFTVGDFGVLKFFSNQVAMSICRKRNQQALRYSNEKYSKAYRVSPDAVNINRLSDGLFLDINLGFTKLTGYRADEVIGKTSLEINLWANSEDRKGLAKMLAETGEVVDYEAEFRVKDGSIRTCLMSAALLDIDDEKCILSVTRDITEKRQTEMELDNYRQNLEIIVNKRTEELQFTNKELEAFSYSVSHDLRAPLRSIYEFSKNLLEDSGQLLEETGLDKLNRIIINADKMSNLIDDLLKLSKVGRAQTTMQRVNMSKLAQACTDECRATNPERNVEVFIAPDLITQGDKQLLGIFFANLLGNAWKYTSKKAEAKIEFGSTLIGGKTVFFVRDNGAGFDMEYVGKLFAPFQRLHRTSEFPGTGIGLAIMARIIQRHDGKIWAEGVVGEGATFYFTIGV